MCLKMFLVVLVHLVQPELPQRVNIVETILVVRKNDLAQSRFLEYQMKEMDERFSVSDQVFHVFMGLDEPLFYFA